MTKSITAGADLHHCSERRISRVLDLVVHCAELPIRSGNINWIEVEYPASNIEVAGVSVHWAICAALASIAGWLLPRVLGRRG